MQFKKRGIKMFLAGNLYTFKGFGDDAVPVKGPKIYENMNTVLEIREAKPETVFVMVAEGHGWELWTNTLQLVSDGAVINQLKARIPINESSRNS